MAGIAIDARGVDKWFGEGEARTQALRDASLAEAYLAWQDALRSRVEDIIRPVVDAYGLRLRLPIAEAAQLLVDVSDDTVARATIEGRGVAEIAERMNERLERLVDALVEQPLAGD